MKSVILTITVLLGLLFVPVIEMKSKRCHKRPTVVECPDPLPCGKNSNMTVSTKDKFVGDTGILDCSAGYSLVGNASIICLESGQWSPIRAICVPDDLEAYVHAFRGSTYTFVKTHKTTVEAKEYCLSMCGTLVEINNKEENQFIYSVISELGLVTIYFNIGLESRNGISFEWQSQNTTVSNMFDDWANNEPHRFEVDGCGYIYRLKWYASGRVECVDIPWSFICESRFD